MAALPIIDIGRDPVFTGKQGFTVEPAADLASAREYVASLRDGSLDPFLSRAWSQIQVIQNRNPNGTFAKGFTVVVDYVRPGAGDDSTQANPDPGDDVEAP